MKTNHITKMKCLLLSDKGDTQSNTIRRKRPGRASSRRRTTPTSGASGPKLELA